MSAAGDDIRPLTGPERALVAAMFGDAVDCAPVTVRRRRWWWLQPRHITMAPDGHIWCHPQGEAWCACFGGRDLSMQALFLHEMTHVWQHQRGICLPLRRPPLARYRYRLVPGRAFTRYGLEQQAVMVADAFLARARGRPDAGLEALLPFGPDLALQAFEERQQSCQ